MIIRLNKDFLDKYEIEFLRKLFLEVLDNGAPYVESMVKNKNRNFFRKS